MFDAAVVDGAGGLDRYRKTVLSPVKIKGQAVVVGELVGYLEVEI